jgi:hypothetical protein
VGARRRYETNLEAIHSRGLADCDHYKDKVDVHEVEYADPSEYADPNEDVDVDGYTWTRMSSKLGRIARGWRRSTRTRTPRRNTTRRVGSTTSLV